MTDTDLDPRFGPDPGTGVAPRDFITTFARGLGVIRAMTERPGAMSLGEVADAVGISRPAARRFLLTLLALGYATEEAGRFDLTPRVLELGYAYLSGLALPQLALPHLERLAGDLGQSAALAVMDGTDVVYLARVPSRRLMRVQINVGTRLPAHLTSMGRVMLAAFSEDQLEHYLAGADLSARTAKSLHGKKALLAELRRVREAGYALVEGELDEDIRGIAVPVHNAHGDVVAAANASIHVPDSARDTITTTILPRLQAAANDLERELRLLPRDAAGASR